MNLLSGVPIWVYYVVLGITFLVVHAISFRPNEPQARGRVLKRVLSSVALLVGLIVINPAEPASLLVALGAAALGGYLSGRAAPPVPRPDGGKG